MTPTIAYLAGGKLYVKQEGRKQVSAVEFANGARLQPEEHFGEA